MTCECVSGATNLASVFQAPLTWLDFQPPLSPQPITGRRWWEVNIPWILTIGICSVALFAYRKVTVLSILVKHAKNANTVWHAFLQQNSGVPLDTPISSLCPHHALLLPLKSLSQEPCVGAKSIPGQ